MSDMSEVPSAMSTSALQSKLVQLKDKSNKLNETLTQKLASSQSGQNLLHIGSSLQTLPPDLHSLLTQLHPVLSSVEGSEKQYLQQLQQLVKSGNEIRIEQRKAVDARDCAEMYRDLLAAEAVVKRDGNYRRSNMGLGSQKETSTESVDLIDHVAALERSAHTALCLVQELKRSSEQISTITTTKAPTPNSNSLPSLKVPLEPDTERAQFLMKLAPRIRRLDSDTVISLTHRFERVLKDFQNRNMDRSMEDRTEQDLLYMIGHCLRGLALLGRAKEIENCFARVAIMPLIRSKLSMGRLDEGGSRGECAGLSSILEEISASVGTTFGPVLRLSNGMFTFGAIVNVDLLTAGVWVPIATALMSDPGIKMAIFSPGIASILQSNYIVLDKFLNDFAKRLLEVDGGTSITNDSQSNLSNFLAYTSPSSESIALAQGRIFSNPKTAEFSKRWNLPIYYQLRFGDCCSRLNTAIDITTQDGWIANVFTGTSDRREELQKSIGCGLSLFLELSDVITSLWSPDVVIRPLAHRFIRGAVQLIGRTIAFVSDGMDGKILFGGSKTDGLPAQQNGHGESSNGSQLSMPNRDAYSWGKSEQDVGAVAWELALLEKFLKHKYPALISSGLAFHSSSSSPSGLSEVDELVKDILSDVCQQMRPLVEKAWNEIIVKILVQKCSKPLAAVKGVAATYRMTNRPPPSQASPFVATILRPLKELKTEFSNRLPLYISHGWCDNVVSTVADMYSDAVEDLLNTVKRTEAALQNRRTRRAASGGMSDGDKVKLQLFLDYKQFAANAMEVGVSESSCAGIQRLKMLTQDAAQSQNAVNGT